MKFPVYLSVIIFVSLSFACSSGNIESEEVFIDDGYKISDKTGDKEEIIFDDAAFAGNGSRASQSRSGLQEVTRIVPDGSRVTTMYDAFGNKTETRIFDGNPLLQLVAVKTTVNGDRQVSVFGQNGTVAALPVAMLDKVLTAPANDLASAAGIFEGRREATTTVAQSSKTLQPMPSYKFPIQQPPPLPASPDAMIETAAPETPQTPQTPAESKPAPTPKIEIPTSKTPSDDLN